MELTVSKYVKFKLNDGENHPVHQTMNNKKINKTPTRDETNKKIKWNLSE